MAEMVLVAEGDWNELFQDKLDWLKQLTETALSDKKLNGHPGWKAYAADALFFQELTEHYQASHFCRSRCEMIATKWDALNASQHDTRYKTSACDTVSTFGS